MWPSKHIPLNVRNKMNKKYGDILKEEKEIQEF